MANQRPARQFSTGFGNAMFDARMLRPVFRDQTCVLPPWTAAAAGRALVGRTTWLDH